MGILIFFNVRKKSDSAISILFRILMNYFQILSTSMSFNFSYPNWALDATEPLKTVGQSSEMVVSFDCFL